MTWDGAHTGVGAKLLTTFMWNLTRLSARAQGHGVDLSNQGTEECSGMHLVQIILPLYSNDGEALDRALFRELREELLDRFGGVTAFTRSAADGLWRDGSRVQRDEVVLYEVMVEVLDRPWWAAYRQQLEARFGQQELVLRAHSMERL